MKKRFLIIPAIINSVDYPEYEKQFNNVTEARHWVINHLDLSKDWKILSI